VSAWLIMWLGACGGTTTTTAQDCAEEMHADPCRSAQAVAMVQAQPIQAIALLRQIQDPLVRLQAVSSILAVPDLALAPEHGDQICSLVRDQMSMAFCERRFRMPHLHRPGATEVVNTDSR